MSLLAPIIAGVSALLAGLGALLWLDKHQPTLKETATPEPEPSLADIWDGKTNYQTVPQKVYQGVPVHPHN